MGVVVPGAGRPEEDGGLEGVERGKPGRWASSLQGARGGRRAALKGNQARPGLGLAASDCNPRPAVSTLPLYLLLGRRQLVLPAVVRHLRAGPRPRQPGKAARREAAG